MWPLRQLAPNCDVCVASVYPSISDMMLQRRKRRNGPQGDIGLAYSITSSAVARSKGEIVPLFSFNVPRDGWWVSDVWGALDGGIPPGLRVVPTSYCLQSIRIA